MTTIGEKNRKIDIYGPSGTNAANEQDGWVLIKSKWARVAGETGMGAIRAAASAGGIVTGLNRYSFRVNYDLSIDTTMQVRDPEGDTYNILTVRHDKAMRQYTDIVAELGGSNG